MGSSFLTFDNMIENTLNRPVIHIVQVHPLPLHHFLCVNVGGQKVSNLCYIIGARIVGSGGAIIVVKEIL